MELAELQAKVGENVGLTDWFLIGQDRIDAFAECTEDRQFIHVDPVAAKAGPFGTTIAHGFLTLSMLAHFLQTGFDKPDVKTTVNYGFDKVRFLSPVKSGKRVRGHFKLLDFTEKRPGQWVIKLECTVEIEGEDKPALIAEWILQFFV
ncbi:MAG: MaoC family dehydratase [Alphaproteobacteria bacterium]|nr:MaoC family dehydratase [Alphaproteobacteria bacterium]